MGKALLFVTLKQVLPAALGGAGVFVAALWSDYFRAFCGLS